MRVGSARPICRSALAADIPNLANDAHRIRADGATRCRCEPRSSPKRFPDLPRASWQSSASTPTRPSRRLRPSERLDALPIETWETRPLASVGGRSGISGRVEFGRCREGGRVGYFGVSKSIWS